MSIFSNVISVVEPTEKERRSTLPGSSSTPFSNHNVDTRIASPPWLPIHPNPRSFSLLRLTLWPLGCIVACFFRARTPSRSRSLACGSFFLLWSAYLYRLLCIVSYGSRKPHALKLARLADWFFLFIPFSAVGRATPRVAVFSWWTERL